MVCAEQRLTTVVVTHSIEEAAFLGRKILLFGHGQGPGRGIEWIDNLTAGQAAYRGSAEYHAMCDQLRGRMAAGVEQSTRVVG